MKTVIFDIDNTLYSFDRANAVAFAAMRHFAEQELGLPPSEYDRLHNEAFQTVKRRCGGGSTTHNRLIRFQTLLEMIGQPISIAPKMERLYWNTLLDAMEVTFGAVETMQALRKMGLSIGIGTNMTADWQFEKLNRLALLPYIDFLVSSEEAGAEKPDLRLFALCAEKSGSDPSECCFVGDSLDKDALAARDAGMMGVWYCPQGCSECPDGIKTVQTLLELPILLQQET